MTSAARFRATLPSAGALAALLVACSRPASVPMPSYPAQMSLECFVPTEDDYAVTIVVPDTTFRDSTWLRPILGEVARNWPVALPLPRYSVDVSLQILRDGRAIEPRIVQASHVREFDRRALAAVRGAVTDTLWPLPARYHRDTLDALVRFGAKDINRAIVQTWYSVVKPPKPDRGNPQPDYPPEKRVGEQVIASFTVDTLGAVDSTSIVILSSTDEDYSAAVLAVLPRWRFSPSTVRGCKVARTLTWEFPGKE